MVSIMALLGVDHRLNAFLELLTIELHLAPAVKAQFKFLRQLQAWRWTGIFAKPAKHAARHVEEICRQHLLAGCRPVPSDFDAMLRARQRAQVASDTQSLACIRIVVQPRRTAEPLGNFRSLLRILFGDVL